MYRSSSPKTATNPTNSFPAATKTRWWRNQVQSFLENEVPQKCPPYLLSAADTWWLTQLTTDIPSLRHTWRKLLKSSSSPEADLHSHIGKYLQDYNIPPDFAPPNPNKFDILLPALQQAHGENLLKEYMSDIIRKNWGYPPNTVDRRETERPSEHDTTPRSQQDLDFEATLRAKEIEELAEDACDGLLSLQHAWGGEIREAAFPVDKLHTLMED